MLTALLGHSACMQLLIDAKANVDVPSSTSAVLLVATFGEPECLQLLLDAKATIHAHNSPSRNALASAAENGSVECVWQLFQPKPRRCKRNIHTCDLACGGLEYDAHAASPSSKCSRKI